jgi:hypothetical protein
MCLTLVFYLFMVPVVPTFWTYLFVRIFIFVLECNHSNMCGMICTQSPTFSAFAFPLRNNRARDYHLEEP